MNQITDASPTFVSRLTACVALPVGVLSVLALAAGCSNADDRRTAPAVTSAATPAATLVLSNPVDHLYGLGREPRIVAHPDGTLFVSGYGEPTPSLWKSGDLGATWTRVNVGTEATGAIGNSDVDWRWPAMEPSISRRWSSTARLGRARASASASAQMWARRGRGRCSRKHASTIGRGSTRRPTERSM